MDDDIFNPRHYRDVRRSPREASTLPGWCYTSRAFLERERERIFSGAWLFAGRLEEIPVGGCRALGSAGGPVLLVHDGKLRAFADSREVHVTGPEIRIATWAGFVFICFSRRTADLRTWFGDMVERLASHRFEDFRVVRRLDYTVRANWKLIAENAMETYHTGTVHGASLGAQVSRDLETCGHWDAIQVLGDSSIAVLPGETPPFPPVHALSREARVGTCFTTLHPNTQLACAQDSLWWLHYLPLAPGRTRLEVGQCFPESTTARDDFAQGSKLYFDRWATGIDEDNTICEAQQLGISSPFHRRGRLSHREVAVHRLNNWILDQVIDDDHGARRIDAVPTTH